MDSKQIEQLLEATSERPGLEFKEGIAWRVETFVKDILAMTNTDEGGHIIVGVKDRTRERVGVTAADRATFDYDVMRDQVAPYAEPQAIFDVEVVPDGMGIEFVVITVHPFAEIPTICKKANERAGTYPGVVYTRTRTRRPESAPVMALGDWIRIIERAAQQRYARARQLVDAGAAVEQERAERLDRELGDL